MVILGQVDQVLQSLGDPIPEKLTEVVKNTGYINQRSLVLPKV